LTVFSLAALMFACKDDDNTGTPNKEKEAPYIDYKSATDFWFPWQAGDTVIAVVDVNGAYRATVAEGGGWCTVSDIAVNSFVIHYAENRIAADRTTKITLSLEGVDDIEIVVSQRGPEPELVIDSTYAELTAPYQGLDTAILVDVNGVYRVEVETGKEWCQIETLTDINFSFGASSSTVPHRFRFSIAQNSELDSRSVKVGVLLTYRDSTARFEFVVNQQPTPILLIGPADGTTVINKENGFPYTFSWNKTGNIPSYSIALSADESFPEDATEVVEVGDVGSYAMTADDVDGVSNLYKTPVYWKVMPTDTAIKIAAETGLFYVQRKVVKSYLLELTKANERWTTHEYYPAENVYAVTVNRGRSDPYVFTAALTKEIPERMITLSYEYKTNTAKIQNPAATGFTFEYFGCIPTPTNPTGADGARMLSEFIPFSEEYQTHVVELGNYVTPWNWGAVGHSFRLDTGTNDDITNMVLYLKNLRIDVYE
jgi:hypothetical protein